MIERKPLTIFLIAAFGLSWIAFLLPLAFKSNETLYSQVALICWSLGMWGPGVAAIIATLSSKSSRSEAFAKLRLNKLGSWPYYIWAWLLPFVLVALTIVLSLLIRTAAYDPELTVLKQMSEQAKQAGQEIPITALLISQIMSGFLIGPAINTLFALGEELGWRGFLLPRLLPLGQWKALLITGVIWGFWHAPVIIQGYNYPEHPYLGVLMMIVFCVLMGIIFGWIYLKTMSPWSAALAHGSLNAWAGLPFIFLMPNFDKAIGGSVLSVTGWLVLGIAIVVLVIAKQLPVENKVMDAASTQSQE